MALLLRNSEGRTCRHWMSRIIEGLRATPVAVGRVRERHGQIISVAVREGGDERAWAAAGSRREGIGAHVIRCSNRVGGHGVATARKGELLIPLPCRREVDRPPRESRRNIPRAPPRAPPSSTPSPAS